MGKRKQQKAVADGIVSSFKKGANVVGAKFAELKKVTPNAVVALWDRKVRYVVRPKKWTSEMVSANQSFKDTQEEADGARSEYYIQVGTREQANLYQIHCGINLDPLRDNLTYLDHDGLLPFVRGWVDLRNTEVSLRRQFLEDNPNCYKSITSHDGHVNWIWIQEKDVQLANNLLQTHATHAYILKSARQNAPANATSTGTNDDFSSISQAREGREEKYEPENPRVFKVLNLCSNSESAKPQIESPALTVKESGAAQVEKSAIGLKVLGDATNTVPGDAEVVNTSEGSKVPEEALAKMTPEAVKTVEEKKDTKVIPSNKTIEVTKKPKFDILEAGKAARTANDGSKSSGSKVQGKNGKGQNAKETKPSKPAEPEKMVRGGKRGRKA